MGTRIAVLRGGVLQQQGPPQTLYDAPDNLFVAAFIGSPAMNLLRGRIELDVEAARVSRIDVVRVLRPTDLPWRRPRRELLILSLVAVAALSPVYPQDSQDPSRLCLAQALSRGSLSADSCLSDVFDRSSHGGHLYSDKAPGLSILQLPSERIFGLGQAPEKWPPFYLQLWGVRVLSVGLLFVLCAFLVGRVAEGLAARLRGRLTRRVRARNDDRAARRHGLLARRHRSPPLRRVRACLEPATGTGGDRSGCRSAHGLHGGPRRSAHRRLRRAPRRPCCGEVRSGRAPGDSAARALRLGRLRGAVAPLLPVRGQLLRRQTGLRPVRPRCAASAADIRGLCRPRRTARRVAGARDRGARAAAAPARSSGRGRARRRRDRPLRAPQLQLLPSLRRALARAALSRSRASVPLPSASDRDSGGSPEPPLSRRRSRSRRSPRSFSCGPRTTPCGERSGASSHGCRCSSARRVSSRASPRRSFTSSAPEASSACSPSSCRLRQRSA